MTTLFRVFRNIRVTEDHPEFWEAKRYRRLQFCACLYAKDDDDAAVRIDAIIRAMPYLPLDAVTYVERAGTAWCDDETWAAIEVHARLAGLGFAIFTPDEGERTSSDLPLDAAGMLKVAPFPRER